jgi:hypothetical protein
VDTVEARQLLAERAHVDVAHGIGLCGGVVVDVDLRARGRVDDGDGVGGRVGDVGEGPGGVVGVGREDRRLRCREHGRSRDRT